MLGGRLRARDHQELAAGLPRHRQRAVGLQVKVLLPGRGKDADDGKIVRGQNMRGM